MYCQWRCKSSIPINIVQCIIERQIALTDEYRDDLTARIYQQIVLQVCMTALNKLASVNFNVSILLY